MPETAKPRTRKPRTATTRAASSAPPAFMADDEVAPPAMEGLTFPSGDTELKFAPFDDSIEAVKWRQGEHERMSGLAFDPVTMQRVVKRPSGRGSYSDQLRPVEMDSDLSKRMEKAAAEGKDYFHPKAGWIRSGTKRETDVEATRTDNVYEDGD